MPVNMSGKTGMTSQHERTVTLDTSAGALAGMKRFEQNPSKICEHIKNPSVQMQTNLLDSNIMVIYHPKEAAGMSVYYL